MEATIEIIAQQHAALVQVIQFLDANGHSNTEVRETVDRILNSRSFDDLMEQSKMELTRIRLK